MTLKSKSDIYRMNTAHFNEVRHRSKLTKIYIGAKAELTKRNNKSKKKISLSHIEFLKASKWKEKEK